MKRTPLYLSFLVIGDEIVSGEKRDSNIVHALNRLKEFDIEPVCVNSCIDNAKLIANQIEFLAQISDIIITSGGLGPTTDDKTREALSIFSGNPLEFHDEKWVEKKKTFTKKFAREFPESNRIQYFKPQDFEWLENPNATADALKYETDKISLYSLAGVPVEFAHSFEKYVLADIKNRVSSKKNDTIRLKFYGIGESALSEIWNEIGLNGSENIKTAYLPSIETGLSVNVFFNYPATKSFILDAIYKSSLANFLVSETGETIETVVVKLLFQKGLSIALAESCTGGLVSNTLSNIHGASSVLKCSLVTYTQDSKERILGINKDFFTNHSVVCSECAELMAKNIKNIAGADITASVTGYLGPNGGDEKSENGTVWMAICYDNECFSFLLKIDPNDPREINKRRVANKLLLEIFTLLKKL